MGRVQGEEGVFRPDENDPFTTAGATWMKLPVW